MTIERDGPGLRILYLQCFPSLLKHAVGGYRPILKLGPDLRFRLEGAWVLVMKPSYPKIYPSSAPICTDFRKYVTQPYLLITMLRNPLERFVSGVQFKHRGETRTIDEAADLVASAMRQQRMT